MASDHPTGGSVFDILYADLRRLSSLLAQFSDDGLETEIVRAAEEVATAKAGVSIKVITGETTETGRESTTRKIDPQWLVPLAFLDKAQDFIQRDIEAASIGSLVLSEGSMTIADLGLLQKLWSVPALKNLVTKQMRDAAALATDNDVEASDDNRNRAQRRADQKAKPKAKPDTSEAELMLELLPVLPHSPQVNIVTDDFAVWSTIEPKWLVGTVEDLILKHGSKVAGGWTVVGILDARPFEMRDDGEYDELLSPLERVNIGMYMENVWSIALNLAMPVRQALGRPLVSYGITPLIIFRAIET